MGTQITTTNMSWVLWWPADNTFRRAWSGFKDSGILSPALPWTLHLITLTSMPFYPQSTSIICIRFSKRNQSWTHRHLAPPDPSQQAYKRCGFQKESHPTSPQNSLPPTWLERWVPVLNTCTASSLSLEKCPGQISKAYKGRTPSKLRLNQQRFGQSGFSSG